VKTSGREAVSTKMISRLAASQSDAAKLSKKIPQFGRIRSIALQTISKFSSTLGPAQSLKRMLKKTKHFKIQSRAPQNLNMASAAPDAPQFKLLLVGDGGVGKTTFVKRHLTVRTMA
jgi:hypothetical protein